MAKKKSKKRKSLLKQYFKTKKGMYLWRIYTETTIDFFTATGIDSLITKLNALCYDDDIVHRLIEKVNPSCDMVRKIEVQLLDTYYPDGKKERKLRKIAAKQDEAICILQLER